MTVPDDEARAQCVPNTFLYLFPGLCPKKIHTDGLGFFRVLCAKLRLDGTFDFSALAKATPGYVGADLSALAGAAGIIGVKRIFNSFSDGTGP